MWESTSMLNLMTLSLYSNYHAGCLAFGGHPVSYNCPG